MRRTKGIGKGARLCRSIACAASMVAMLGLSGVEAQAECWSAGGNRLNLGGVYDMRAIRQATSFNTPAAIAFGLANCPGVIMNNASATPFGTATYAPTGCTRLVNASSARVTARWPSTTARTMAGTMAGCVFMCGSTTCRVQGSDGLPVELLGFGVE